MTSSPSPPPRFDLGWNRSNRLALTVLAALGGAAMAFLAAGRDWTGQSLRVDSRRVQAATEKIDPNTASVGSLRRLPGLGAVKAQAIVDYRLARPGRPFTRAEDLAAVKGIGPALVEGVRPYLALGGRERQATGP